MRNTKFQSKPIAGVSKAMFLVFFRRGQVWSSVIKSLLSKPQGQNCVALHRQGPESYLPKRRICFFRACCTTIIFGLPFGAVFEGRNAFGGSLAYLLENVSSSTNKTKITASKI